jgi:hypothetical protein
LVARWRGDFDAECAEGTEKRVGMAMAVNIERASR